jgi:hypothetical protein
MREGLAGRTKNMPKPDGSEQKTVVDNTDGSVNPLQRFQQKMPS